MRLFLVTPQGVKGNVRMLRRPGGLSLAGEHKLDTDYRAAVCRETANRTLETMLIAQTPSHSDVRRFQSHVVTLETSKSQEGSRYLHASIVEIVRCYRLTAVFLYSSTRHILWCMVPCSDLDSITVLIL